VHHAVQLRSDVGGACGGGAGLRLRLAALASMRAL
jgi:hypothetical protein